LFLFACGSVLATVSLLYERVEDLHTFTPCLYAAFTVPVKVATFGFPLAFLSRTDWVRMIGCGPIFGKFSNYFFCIFKFTADAVFYTLVIFPLFLFTRLATKRRSARQSAKLTGLMVG
jgi:hypothetical protein